MEPSETTTFLYSKHLAEDELKLLEQKIKSEGIVLPEERTVKSSSRRGSMSEISKHSRISRIKFASSAHESEFSYNTTLKEDYSIYCKTFKRIY